MLHRTARLRWAILLGLAVLAAGPLDTARAQPRFRPPTPPVFRPPTPPGMNPGNPFPNNPGGINPRMPGMGGPIFKNVWTCGKCGREIGDGAFPPAQCPFCGAHLINGIGAADPKYGGGNPGAGANPGVPNMPGMPNPPPVIPNPPVMPPQPPAANPPVVTRPGGNNVNPQPAPQPAGGGTRFLAGTSTFLRVAVLVLAGVAVLVVLIVAGLVLWCLVASQNVGQPRRRRPRDDEDEEDDALPSRRPRAAPLADAAPSRRDGFRSRRSSG